MWCTDTVIHDRQKWKTEKLRNFSLYLPLLWTIHSVEEDINYRFETKLKICHFRSFTTDVRTWINTISDARNTMLCDIASIRIFHSNLHAQRLCSVFTFYKKENQILLFFFCHDIDASIIWFLFMFVRVLTTKNVSVGFVVAICGKVVQVVVVYSLVVRLERVDSVLRRS